MTTKLFSKFIASVATLALMLLVGFGCGVPTDDLGQNLGADTASTLAVTPPDSPPPAASPPLVLAPPDAACVLAAPDPVIGDEIPCKVDADCCPANVCTQQGFRVTTGRCLPWGDVGLHRNFCQTLPTSCLACDMQTNSCLKE